MRRPIHVACRPATEGALAPDPTSPPADAGPGTTCPACGNALRVDVRKALASLPASLLTAGLRRDPAAVGGTGPSGACSACEPLPLPVPQAGDLAAAFDLLGNPFHLLGASPLDPAAGLVARATWRERQIGSAASRALAVLLDPTDRLLAEVSWMPRTRPPRADQVIRLILTDPASDLPLRGMSPLACANAVATQLASGRYGSHPERARARVEALGSAVAAIEPHGVAEDVQADRAMAGFPDLDPAAVAAALARLHRFHLRAALTALLP